MDAFPHLYTVTARAATDGDVALDSRRLPRLPSASPREFGGPGDRWSPETLLVAAVADCFVLTFRAVAAAARLRWASVTCHVDGTLDRVDRVTQFTAFTIRTRLWVSDDIDVEAGRRALERAERACLIRNSLKAPCHLDAEVDVTPAHNVEPATA